MKITLLRGILLLFSATFCFVTATTTSETIEVNFKTTCSSSIELQFNRAVSLLHRFRTEDARIAFSDIVKTDPDCAIAYWGLAMTCWSQTKFFPPTPAAHKEGSGFIDEAYVVGKKHGKLNLLEKHLIRALYSYYTAKYKPGERYAQHYERVNLYIARMEEAYEAERKSVEMRAFYALSLLSGQVWYARRNKAKINIIIDICKEILEVSPNHPGALNYILHAHNEPGLANQTIDYLDKYIEMKPDPWIPSSILTLLGDWNKVIRINGEALAMWKGPLTSDGILLLDQLTNAYVHSSQFKKAKQTIEKYFDTSKLATEKEDDGIGFIAAFYHPTMWGRLLLEELKFEKAAEWVDPSSLTASDSGTVVQIMTNGINALGSFYLSDEEALKNLATDQFLVAKTLHTGPQIPMPNGAKNELNRLTMLPEILVKYVLGGTKVAIEDIKEMATTQETAWNNAPIFSLHELAGYMEWKNGRFCDAFSSFQRALDVWPNRYSVSFNAAFCADKCGRKAEAKVLYANFVALHDGQHVEVTHRYKDALQYIKDTQKSNDKDEEPPKESNEEEEVIHIEL